MLQTVFDLPQGHQGLFANCEGSCVSASGNEVSLGIVRNLPTVDSLSAWTGNFVRHLMAGVLKNDGKEMPSRGKHRYCNTHLLVRLFRAPRNLEEAFLPALQHRLQVFASKLARGILNTQDGSTTRHVTSEDPAAPRIPEICGGLRGSGHPHWQL